MESKSSKSDLVSKDSELTLGGDDGDTSLDYDTAVKIYGSGRYQVVLFVFLALITFSTVFNNNAYIFIGGNMNHTCRVPATTDNSSLQDHEANITYITGECSYSVVVSYDNGTTSTLEDDIPCTSWDYDTSEFSSTIMSEWNLNSCNGKVKIALASSLFMIGFLIGCFILADLSDRFGRRIILLVSCAGMVVTGVAASFSVNYEMLVTMRLLLGIFTAGARNAGFVYVCEIVEWRSAAGMIHGSIYSLGGVMVTAIAHLLPNWRHFQLACALSYILYLPCYWLMTESPRWLLSQGRHEAAREYFRKSAKYNKKILPKDFDVHLISETKKEGSVLTLFQTPNLRSKTLIVAVLWFTVSIVFFGMNYNVGNLTGNIFVNNYLLQATGVIEFLGIWYINLGRRPAISSAFLITTLLSTGLIILSLAGIPLGTVILAMLGKLLVETNFEFIYIVTSEMYPTTARVTAMGLGSSVARVGGAISPYIVLTHDIFPNTPYIIFAVLTVIAGLLAILIPETMGARLPDSIKEAEETGLAWPTLCKAKKHVDLKPDGIETKF